MDDQRVYVIGLGVIGHSHAASVAAFPRTPNVELIAADPDAHARARFHEQYPKARLFDNAATAMAQPSRPDDIVVVATPVFTHCELTCAALETGRHVLCEKPFAMNRKEAEQMVEVARNKDRLVGCCSSRFLGRLATQKVKEMMRSGRLGNIYHLDFINRAPRSRCGIEYQPSSRWFLDSSKNGGGCLMDWGPYDFSLLNDLLSCVRVEVCGGWMASPTTAADPKDVVFDVEEHIGATLKYHQHDGAVISITYERSACFHGDARRTAELHGTKGSVNFDWLGFPQDTNRMTLYYDRGGVLETETITYEDKNALSPFYKALVNFYRSVKGEEAPSVLNEQALFNFSCLRAIYDCIATGSPQTVEKGA